MYEKSLIEASYYVSLPYFLVHESLSLRYLVFSSQGVVSQQRPVVYRVRSVVDEDGPVLYL